MSDLSVLDLQNLRHLIGGYDTSRCKMEDYASQAEDPEIKKLFQDAADSAMKNKQTLIKRLRLYKKRLIVPKKIICVRMIFLPR